MPHCLPIVVSVSLDFSNAFNTVDRRDIAEGLRQYAPILYRAGRWAYGCTSSLVLSSPEGRHIITSAQGVRQGDPMGPLMFSLGIRSLLRDLASALGPNRLILAYLDDIYILSPDDSALEQTLAFFDERQPSIRLNPAKCKTLALEDIRTNGLRMLHSALGTPHPAQFATTNPSKLMHHPVLIQPNLRFFHELFGWEVELARREEADAIKRRLEAERAGIRDPASPRGLGREEEDHVFLAELLSGFGESAE